MSSSSRNLLTNLFLSNDSNNQESSTTSEEEKSDCVNRLSQGGSTLNSLFVQNSFSAEDRATAVTTTTTTANYESSKNLYNRVLLNPSTLKWKTADGRVVSKDELLKTSEHLRSSQKPVKKVVLLHPPPPPPVAATTSNSIPDEFTQAPVQSFGEQLNRKRKLISDDDNEDLVNDLLADSGDEEANANDKSNKEDPLVVSEVDTKNKEEVKPQILIRKDLFSQNVDNISHQSNVLVKTPEKVPHHTILQPSEQNLDSQTNGKPSMYRIKKIIPHPNQSLMNSHQNVLDHHHHYQKILPKQQFSDFNPVDTARALNPSIFTTKWRTADGREVTKEDLLKTSEQLRSTQKPVNKIVLNHSAQTAVIPPKIPRGTIIRTPSSTSSSAISPNQPGFSTSFSMPSSVAATSLSNQPMFLTMAPPVLPPTDINPFVSQPSSLFHPPPPPNVTSRLFEQKFLPQLTGYSRSKYNLVVKNVPCHSAEDKPKPAIRYSRRSDGVPLYDDPTLPPGWKR